MTSSYLNSNFPKVESLFSDLDARTSELKTRESSIIKSIVEQHEITGDFRRRQLDSLAIELKRVISANDKVVDQQEKAHLSRFIEECAPESAVNPAKRQLDRIASLVDARNATRCLSQLAQLDKSADMATYLKASELEKRLSDVFSVSSSQALRDMCTHGINHVDQNYRLPLQKQAHSDLRVFLKESKWPNNIVDLLQFKKLFASCLATEGPTSCQDQTKAFLQPLQSFSVLAEAFEVRFKFHFGSNRETNRLDKVEWVFNYVVSFVEEHSAFLDESVQEVLSQADHIDGSERIALHEFITALLPVVSRKISKLIPQVLESPDLLAHTIYETQNFDGVLKEKFFYSPFGHSRWNGLSGHVLSRKEWFSRWLDIEREAALQRFHEILESPNAWNIDWESVDTNKTKPTVSALLIKDLLESITEKYDKLTSVQHRLKFLEIQISILDKYYERLSESLDAFESMSSGLVRAVGGISAENAKLVSGLNGLERLCRIYGSIAYLIRSLEKWGQDLFFVELWEDISRVNERSDQKSITTKESSITIPEDEDNEGTLFDETVISFQKLLNRVILNINNLIGKEIKSSMREYFRSTHWHGQSPSSEMSISAQLVIPIKNLSGLLSYLSRFHTPNDFLKTSKVVGKDLGNYIYNYIVQANVFDQVGGKQLSKDVDEIWSSLLLPRDSVLLFQEDICKILSCDPSMLSEGIIELKEQLGLTMPIDDIQRIINRRRDI